MISEDDTVFTAIEKCPFLLSLCHLIPLQEVLWLFTNNFIFPPALMNPKSSSVIWKLPIGATDAFQMCLMQFRAN